MIDVAMLAGWTNSDPADWKAEDGSLVLYGESADGEATLTVSADGDVTAEIGCLRMTWEENGTPLDVVIRTLARALEAADATRNAEVDALRAEVRALRRSLARCYVLAGSDPDGCDPDTDDGAMHLYGDAERAVRELRQDHDEAVREAGELRGELDTTTKQRDSAFAFVEQIEGALNNAGVCDTITEWSGHPEEPPDGRQADPLERVAMLIEERDALARRVEELTAEADLRVRREREAVVAWLRRYADRGWNSPTGGAEMWSALRHAAAMIEAGGHVEGEP